eukprot:TRINITY_DN21385_c0_g1_i1.p1 TRINITY_DN21385_c0_g1~~TRINITY_DN21385_c0_g1_i1.p1  ORF type:complete len:477 (-),score=77.18 TRINITY_DN21385_c0_g1_i1:41-1471(-)
MMHVRRRENRGPRRISDIQLVPNKLEKHSEAPNMSPSTYYYLFVILASLQCSAHPFTNFYMYFADSDGGLLQGEPSFQEGAPSVFQYIVKDSLRQWETVQLGNVEPMHQRRAHILLASADMAWTAHIHPDDFYDLSVLSPNTTLWRLNITFPRAGQYSILMTFLYKDPHSQLHREGNAQMTFMVNGTSDQGKTPSWGEGDFSVTRYFTSYPIGDNDLFDDWINTTSNGQTSVGFGEQYRVTLNVFGSNETNRNIVSNLVCTYFTITVYQSSTSNTPAKLVPYLAAPAHFTFNLNDGGIYHAHGTYLLPGQNMSSLQSLMNGMDMTKMMSYNPTSDWRYNASMNAYMVGLTGNGTLDCNSDMGPVMDDMMGMMNMDQYYGPPDYGKVVGIFGFPEAGPWRVWIYMKMELPNGEHRLIIPQFNIFAPIGGGSITPTSTSTSTSSAPVTSSQEQDTSSQDRTALPGILGMVCLLCHLVQ